MFFAHTRPGRPVEEWEPLETHLKEVAHAAAAFASAFGASDWGLLAGLWHDLGKYRDSFQQYLRKVGGASEDGSEEGAPGRVDHSTVGAIHARETLGPVGKVAAYLIAGHHAGLPDAVGDGRSLGSRLEQRDLLKDWRREAIPEDISKPPPPLTKPPSMDSRQAHLWLRMLFSCITDADYLATEKFMNPERSLSRMQDYPGVQALAEQLASYLQTAFAPPETDLARLRGEVLRACVTGATQEPGLFTLTVPTGGGKTLSSMAFALNHAKAWGKGRVIYAIPYTSIIEQTADLFREVFGSERVVEHHSNVDPDDPERDSLTRRLAAENWDAPIVVTTNVQLFESLFAARSSRCRKLHNIVNSVVVLDEAQLLPPDFLDPIRQAIRALARDYRVTFVISTATQPALGFDEARELAPDPERLDRRLRRVRYEWPTPGEFRTWESVASEIAPFKQVLCIVNKRDDARTLYELIREQEGAVHLSALMCGAHRAGKIAEIKVRLKSGKAVRLVSTQLIEAGVDIDFPVVYRAFAGLDSIAQAAGRCNREAGLSELGRVVVFNPPTPPPPGLLRKAESKAREVLSGRESAHLDPALFSKYFDLLYRQGVNSLDRHAILDLLGRDSHRMDFQFRTAAELFRLVDESGYGSILVDWGHGRELIEELRRWGAERLRMRRVQRFLVNVPARQLRKLQASGDVEEILPSLFAVATSGVYDAELGLRTDGREYEPGELIC